MLHCTHPYIRSGTMYTYTYYILYHLYSENVPEEIDESHHIYSLIYKFNEPKEMNRLKKKKVLILSWLFT